MKRHQTNHFIDKVTRYSLILILVTLNMNIYASVSIKNGTPCLVPTRDVVIGNNTITVSYDFTEITEVCDSSNTIHHDIPGFGHCNEVGKPMLPMRIDTFRIPYGYEISITTTASEPYLMTCNYTSVNEPLTESSDIKVAPQEIASYEGIYPADNATIKTSYILRDENIAEIMVSPLQYDYENNIAYIYDKITYTLTFTPRYSYLEDSECLGYKNLETRGDTYLDNFLSNSLVYNSTQIGNVDDEFQEGYEGSVGYLIVTKDSYIDALENFIGWKKILGYTIYILSKPSWSDGFEVQEAIREFREMHDNIRYLTIIGGHKDVPAIKSNRKRTHLTDNYFGTMTDSQYIPDIYIGRIPADNYSEAYFTLDKLIRFEMCPVVDDEYYNNAIHCAYFEGSESDKNTENARFVLTSEDIRDYVGTKGIDASRFYRAQINAIPQHYNTYYGLGKAIPEELQYPNFDWKCTHTQIIERFNQGALYALYRGHGSTSGWSNVGFTNYNLTGLNNSELYSTIFSITCETGNFMYDCFAERMLKLQEAGATSVIASSQVSYSGYNDSLAEGIIDAIWPVPGLIPQFGIKVYPYKTNINPSYKLGQILEQGLFRMNERWGTVDKELVMYEYEVFHLFGDPSMDFFTENPKGFENVEIVRNEDGIYVSTNGENASISFYNTTHDISYKYETDNIYLPTDDEKNTIICITGHNRLPYLDGIILPFNPDPGTISYIQKSDNYSTASINNNFSGAFTIIITDITGSCIYRDTLENFDNIADIVTLLPKDKGVFLLSVYQDGNIIHTKKIIK